MKRTLNPALLDRAGALIYGVKMGLLDGSALRRLDGRCPIHDAPLVHRTPDRCRLCLEALRDETWPTAEPTKGARRG